MSEFFKWLSTNQIAASTIIIAFGLLIVSIVLIYIIAFFQGRGIAFWPPKIGAKPKNGKFSKTKEQITPCFSELGIIKYYQHRNESALLKHINELLEEAQIIKFLGIKGVNIFPGRHITEKEIAVVKNNRKKNIKILLLDPVSKYLEQRVQDIGHTSLKHKKDITHAVDDVETLIQEAKGINVEYFLYDFMPVWHLLFIDDRLFLAFYLKEVRGEDSPCIELQKDSPLYFAFDRYFDEIWKECKNNNGKKSAEPNG